MSFEGGTHFVTQNDGGGAECSLSNDEDHNIQDNFWAPKDENGESETEEDVNSASIKFQSFDIAVPPSYKVETVDVPSSPGQLKLACGFAFPVEDVSPQSDGDEDRSIYQAHLLANGMDVQLVKDTTLAEKRKDRRKVIPVAEDLLNQSFEDLTLNSEISDFPDIIPDSPDELPEIKPDSSSSNPEPIKELTAAEEAKERRAWRACSIIGVDTVIDLHVLEPYKRVLSHGGYLSQGSKNAIIVFSACFLPDRSRCDYDYVMNNLFMYVISTLEQLVTDDYVLVYLHGATHMGAMPKFSWLKQCYRMIDRKLRKNLKGLYLVHPTFWLKTLFVMIQPFISAKFGKKLFFIRSLSELFRKVPLERASIPEKVINYDFSLFQESSVFGR